VRIRDTMFVTILEEVCNDEREREFVDLRDTMFVTILEEVCNNEREKVYDYKHLLCELYAYGVAATSRID